ncbi:MAG TPA: MFS transporter [Solirubrobacteraceae bacterium]
MRKTLRLPVYRRLLVAYGLNELAWSVGTLALSVLVYRRTGSVLGSTAFFLTAQILPAFVAPVLVARLDQRPMRTLLPALYTLEAVIFGLLAWMAGSLAISIVLALAFADGVVAVVARSFSRTATVAELVPADLLPEGNALTNGVFSVAFMAGPAIGGAVVVAGGTVAALLANCGIFAAMAVVLATAGLRGPSADPLNAGRRLRAALGHVRGTRPLRRLMLLQAAGVVFFTISIPVEVVFAQQTLHSGAGGYGALLSAWGAGAVAGSAFYARWRRQSARILIAASAAALACGFAVMAVAPTIAVAVVGAALGGVSNGVEMVAMRTALQERTEERWMAIVVSLNEAVSQATPGLGIVLGGAIAALTDPRVALGVAAAGSLAFTVAAWLGLSPAALGPPVHSAAGPPGRTSPAVAGNGAQPQSASSCETVVP